MKKTYLGMDYLVRVVDVDSPDGVYRRTIDTLCFLSSPVTDWNNLPEHGGLIGGSMFPRNLKELRIVNE